MAENLPRTQASSETPLESVPETDTSGEESLAEGGGDSSEAGPRPGTSSAETILADERESVEQQKLAQTRKNLSRYAKDSSQTKSTDTTPPPPVKHAGSHKDGLIMGTGKNLLALFGLFGSWIMMALKGAGAMAGKGGGGGGGHAKKDDHGGGHH